MFPIQLSYNDLRRSEGYCENGFDEFQRVIKRVLGFIPQTPDEKFDLVWCPLTQLVLCLASQRADRISTLPLFRDIELGEVGPEFEGLLKEAQQKHCYAILRFTISGQLRNLQVLHVYARDLRLRLSECRLVDFVVKDGHVECTDISYKGSVLDGWSLEDSRASFRGRIRLQALSLRDSRVEITAPQDPTAETLLVRSNAHRSRLTFSGYTASSKAVLKEVYAVDSAFYFRTNTEVTGGHFAGCTLDMDRMVTYHFESCNFSDTLLGKRGNATYTRCQFHGRTNLPWNASTYVNCHFTHAQFGQLQAAGAKVVDPIVEG
jgi:hypothetical protein